MNLLSLGASFVCMSLVGAKSLRGLQYQEQNQVNKCERILEARIRSPDSVKCKDGACGTVTFQCAHRSSLTEITYDLTGLTPGRHALHVHENPVDGDCLSTGGHWNPTGENHGGNLE